MSVVDFNKPKTFTPWSGSLQDWAKQFVPHLVKSNFSQFHNELIADLQHSDKQHLVRLAPRGSGKSTLLGEVYPLFCLCEQTEKFILIVSGEQGLPIQWVEDVKRELETNEAILKRYGKLKNNENRWRADWIELTNGCVFAARGSIKGSTRGIRSGAHRPSLVIADEVESEENVLTRFQRAKTERWFMRSLMNVGTPTTRYLVIGTPLHFDSLIWKLASSPDPQFADTWDRKIYRAWELKDSDLVSYWPEVWSIDRLLKKRKEIGELAFAQEYLMEPKSESDRLFIEEYFRWNSPASYERWNEGHLDIVIGVDPAMGGGDYTGVCVLGRDTTTNTGTLHVLSLQLYDWKWPALIEGLFQYCEKWHPRTIGIESVAFQAAIEAQLTIEMSRRGLYIPVTKISVSGKGPKELRIGGLAPLIANHTICFCHKDLHTGGLFRDDVIQQFLYFPSTDYHDDAPDALFLATCLFNKNYCLQPLQFKDMVSTTTKSRRDDDEMTETEPEGWENKSLW